MNSYELESLASSLSHAFGSAANVFGQNFPNTPNPFNHAMGILSEAGSRFRYQRMEGYFYFNSPAHEDLLNRYRIERAMWKNRPDIFNEPEAIVYPPALDGKETPIANGNVREWFSSNAFNLPSDTYILELPAYELKCTLSGNVVETSICRAYGEEIRTDRHSSSILAISEDVFLKHFEEWLGCKPVNYNKCDSQTDDAYHVRLRKAAIELRDGMYNDRDTYLNGLDDDSDFVKEWERISRELRVFITREERWSKPKVRENMAWWQTIKFDLVKLEPKLLEFWKPVQLEVNNEHN